LNAKFFVKRVAAPDVQTLLEPRGRQIYTQHKIVFISTQG